MRKRAKTWQVAEARTEEEVEQWAKVTDVRSVGRSGGARMGSAAQGRRSG